MTDQNTTQKSIPNASGQGVPKSRSRRRFIVRALAGGTGVMMGVTYFGRNALRRMVFSAKVPVSFNGDTSDPLMWFEVTKDGKIRLFSPKVEMGQGTFTGLAQIAADELEVRMDQIEMVHATSDRGNLDMMSTGGSTSIAGLWQPLRELAATMREMLKTQAAESMGVSATELSVKEGVVSGSGQSMTYGEIAASVKTWKVPKTPALKDVSSYRFVGKPVPRVDLEAKVFGDPIFGLDATMPDMLYGSVLRPKKIGAKLVSVETSKAESMPGVVKVIRDEDFVGVVANTRMQAERAKRALSPKWETEHEWQTAHVQEMIRVGKGNPQEVQLVGKAQSVLDEAEQSKAKGFFRAEYSCPIGAHAQMEPNGALADVRADHATIVLSTQVTKITRDEVAQRLGLKPEQVKIVPTYLGGGFGRRLHTPNAMQAAVMSKIVGKPVKCYFTREEEFQLDTFRPPTHHVLRALVDDSGKIKAIDHEFASGSVMFGSPLVPEVMGTLLNGDIGAIIGGLVQYKTIPNLRAVAWHVPLPFKTSWWRGLGLLPNTFAMEGFIDEIAMATGQDPIKLRLANIEDDEAGKRLKAVIQAAVKNANYTDKPSNGRAMGFACSTDGETAAANVVEVSIEQGRIRVHKVVCVMDAGLAVNPDQVKAQCEGATCMGLSAAMYERMEIKDGQLTPTIFGPYRMAMMKDTPREIHVELIDGSGVPERVGEPPIGPIGAAIANAVARLTGDRLRSMPLASGKYS